MRKTFFLLTVIFISLGGVTGLLYPTRATAQTRTKPKVTPTPAPTPLNIEVSVNIGSQLDPVDKTKSVQVVQIEFSETLSENLEYYQIIAPGQLTRSGKSKALLALYNEPELRANYVWIDSKILGLYFGGVAPASRQELHQIIIRVVKTVQLTLTPKKSTSYITWLNFDPTEYADWQYKGKRYQIPEPISIPQPPKILVKKPE